MSKELTLKEFVRQEWHHAVIFRKDVLALLDAEVERLRLAYVGLHGVETSKEPVVAANVFLEEDATSLESPILEDFDLTESLLNTVHNDDNIFFK